MATNDSVPLFAKRLPLIQLLSDERRSLVDTTNRGVYAALDHYQQFMVLEAGIAGVVIPLLHSQPGLVDPTYLHRAIVSMAASLAVGILIAAVSRWFAVYTLFTIAEHFIEQDRLLAEAPTDDEVAVAAALQRAKENFEPRARKIKRIIPWGVIGDVLFYGLFLTGLAFIAAGVK